MKIEKINDRQIRCTLTRSDLAERNLKLSELAYGSEKARDLFREMMRQASCDFGFEADNLPLMIEAIPSPAGSIVVVITKVEDPEELDTRFSRFTPSADTENSHADLLDKLQGAENLLDFLEKIRSASSSSPAKAPAEAGSAPQKGAAKISAAQKGSAKAHGPAGIQSDVQAGTSADTAQEEDASENLMRLFTFPNLDSVIRAARLVSPGYTGISGLYKDPVNQVYVLLLSPEGSTRTAYFKVCNMLSEYSAPEDGDGTVLAFLSEHFDVIVGDDALNKLGAL